MTARTRDRTTYSCSECGQTTPRWVGRCPECQAWGTVDAGGPAAVAAPRVRPVTAAALPIGQIDLESARAQATGVDELDRVLGGGLVPGAVVLLAGEPGVGKSTLLLEVAHRYAAAAGRPALVVTGEESTAAVRLRAERTGGLHPKLYLAAETDLGALASHVDALRPGLLIVDSIQTVASADVDGAAGGVTQVRAATAALIALAKSRAMATVLVGHVTKDGSVAGPRLLEHLVDVVLHFDGERHSTLRLLRAVKNRFGAADEVGCFELRDDGIAGLPDPSGLFLTHRDAAVPGTCLTVTVEGKRPMLAEIQALATETSLSMPRRAVAGLDSARLAMILAVLDRRAGIKLVGRDVYAATVGGMRITEPAVDLAMALAIASGERDLVLPAGLVALGEVGLAGDVRRVGGVARRLAEAARLGFTEAVVPAGQGNLAPARMRVREVGDLASALQSVACGALTPC